jgi:hypothetical protein
LSVAPDELARTRSHVLLAAAGLGALAIAAAIVLAVLGLRAEAPAGQPLAVRGGPPAARAFPPKRTVAHAASRRLFGSKSFWNRRLPASAPVDPSSSALVSALVGELQQERAAGIGPWIGTGSGSTPVYRVGDRQARVRVHLDDRGVHGWKPLQRALASVPIPPHAKPAPGSDRHMTILQASSDTLWELFGARRAADGWHARWGGAIRHVSESPGYYTASAWPGATRNWGATASSLPIVGGTMLLDELAKGSIRHALAINLPAPRAGAFAWPAQRTDGTGPPSALPEGARLRLDPALDVASLHLPKLTRMIALAAQRYGLVVRDQTHHGTSLFGEVPTSRAVRAYKPYFRGRTPGQLLADFPWDRLQVLAMHLCTAAPCRSA